MAYARRQTRGVTRFPNYGGKAHSPRPGKAGRAARAVKATRRTIGQGHFQAKMPNAPVGRAITRKNQDRLPRR